MKSGGVLGWWDYGCCMEKRGEETGKGNKEQTEKSERVWKRRLEKTRECVGDRNRTFERGRLSARARKIVIT